MHRYTTNNTFYLIVLQWSFIFIACRNLIKTTECVTPSIGEGFSGYGLFKELLYMNSYAVAFDHNAH